MQRADVWSTCHISFKFAANHSCLWHESFTCLINFIWLTSLFQRVGVMHPTHLCDMSHSNVSRDSMTLDMHACQDSWRMSKKKNSIIHIYIHVCMYTMIHIYIHKYLYIYIYMWIHLTCVKSYSHVLHFKKQMSGMTGVI